MEAARHESSIRQRAYAIWEEEGRPDGREWDHWERASRELLKPAPQVFESTPQPKRKTAKGRIRAVLKSAMAS